MGKTNYLPSLEYLEEEQANFKVLTSEQIDDLFDSEDYPLDSDMKQLIQFKKYTLADIKGWDEEIDEIVEKHKKEHHMIELHQMCMYGDKSKPEFLRFRKKAIKAVGEESEKEHERMMKFMKDYAEDFREIFDKIFGE